MTTIINGSSPSITFSDSTTQTTAFTGSASQLTTGTLPFSVMPTGSVLQVVSATKTDVFTASSGSWVSITGLSASITPKFSTSKIVIMASVSFGTRAASDYDVAFALYKNGSAITGATGDTAGSRTRCSFSGASRQDYELNNGGMNYLDSPASTSAQTYAVYGRYNGGTMYINRCYFDSDDAGTERGVSTITVMEIAA